MKTRIRVVQQCHLWNAELNSISCYHASARGPLHHFHVGFFSKKRVIQTRKFVTLIDFIILNGVVIQSQIYGYLLIVNTLIIAVEMPFTLYFLHRGTMHSENICAGWITLNYSLYQLSIFLMIWTSIERYLFIYHEQFILRHIILFHYGPIAVLSLYCSVLYVGIVLLYTCQPAYNVGLYLCGGPCYSSEPFLGMFDWVGNGISMELGTLLINIILVIRHLIQRYRMRRSILPAAGRQQWVRDVLSVLYVLYILFVLL